MFVIDYLIPFLLALGPLVIFHELGHYVVARLCGVKVLRFSIGLGKPLLRWQPKANGTEWVLAPFPFGGYVKMLDEREAPVAEADLSQSFNRQSVWRRIAIVAAGPIANLLLAIIIFSGLNISGVEQLRPRIDEPAAGTAAAAAGLHGGDEIVAVNGTETPGWQDLRWRIISDGISKPELELQIRAANGSSERSVVLNVSSLDLDNTERDALEQLGLGLLRPLIKPEIGEIQPGSAADQAGLRLGDVITTIDHKPVKTWQELVELVSAAPGKALEFSLTRDKQTLQHLVIPATIERNGHKVGLLGVRPAGFEKMRQKMLVEVRYAPIEAIVRATRHTWDTATTSVVMIGKMLLGDISVKNLSGPITIADFAGQSAKLGLDYFLGFVALISISLGVLNLLPIPVLDGGHLVYYTVEIIKGSPVSERVMEIGQQLGMALLFMLMAFAFYNDINRLITG